MKILTVITTYNRPELCAALIKALLIEMQESDHTHTLLIADDGSKPDYATALADSVSRAGHRSVVIRCPENMGKANYWSLMRAIYKRSKSIAWHVMVQLPDDVLPVAGMYNAAVNALYKFKSAGVLINLYRCHRDQEWGSPRPFDIDDTLRYTGWMDMCYACKRAVIVALEYTVHPIYRDWRRHPEMGSGVGAQLSRRLRELSITQYQFKQSLVIDRGEHKSQMNPQRTFQFKSV